MNHANSQRFGINHAYIVLTGQQMNTIVHTKTCSSTQNHRWTCNTIPRRTILTYKDFYLIDINYEINRMLIKCGRSVQCSSMFLINQPNSPRKLNRTHNSTRLTERNQLCPQARLKMELERMCQPLTRPHHPRNTCLVFRDKLIICAAK